MFPDFDKTCIYFFFLFKLDKHEYALIGCKSDDGPDIFNNEIFSLLGAKRLFCALKGRNILDLFLVEFPKASLGTEINCLVRDDYLITGHLVNN